MQYIANGDAWYTYVCGTGSSEKGYSGLLYMPYSYVTSPEKWAQYAGTSTNDWFTESGATHVFSYQVPANTFDIYAYYDAMDKVYIPIILYTTTNTVYAYTNTRYELSAEQDWLCTLMPLCMSEATATSYTDIRLTFTWLKTNTSDGVVQTYATTDPPSYTRLCLSVRRFGAVGIDEALTGLQPDTTQYEVEE